MLSYYCNMFSLPTQIPDYLLPLFGIHNIDWLSVWLKDYLNQSFLHIVTFVVLLSLLVSGLIRVLRRVRVKIPIPTVNINKPRFRKRDKVLFYGRKFIRKVKSSLPGKFRRKRPIFARSIISRPPSTNFSSVALVSASDDVPLYAFALELLHALSAIRPCLHLTSEIVKECLGANIFETSNECRVNSWLGLQENQHRLVLYQCDKNFTTWSHYCIRQADYILVVGLASSEPTLGRVEEQMDRLSLGAERGLILLHEHATQPPSNTVAWLNMRSWCSSHHHLRSPERIFVCRSKAKLREYYSSIVTSPPDLHSDFSRLARFLTGTSIGLILGGGGARGAAHVGIIQALYEANIPIDMIGGVSIGAFMGALYCQEMNMESFTEKARQFCKKMTSYWRQIIDLTYPVTAMFTGAAFNQIISEFFGERQIEDLWRPFFCVTTDITFSCQRVHCNGSLWRYVRSSMSLSGYLPPLCDPIDGHLLLDGGYVNNLPADIMRDRMGAEIILAIDVGSQDDTDLYNYGDTLNGWWLLWKRWNPFCEPIKVPSLPEIQSRLAFVSCVQQLERVKNSEYCTYIRPPIDKWKTLQFGSFDEIKEVGYIHGKALFSPVKIDSLKSLRIRALAYQHNENLAHPHQE
ncbi:patatin like phospholipase domain containing sws [Brevipalpus obovatus]|uniref:patatin like phospholipase domain containing sws n=1 Tax=Brevipalpus obovatus TaxID=246614 RepID=UPI003D9DE20B